MKVEGRWLPSQGDFDLFARISGDDNPIHVDPGFAADSAFGRTVSHGMLIYARLWGLIHTAHPGARQVNQTLMFPNPCYAGEEVVLTVTGDLPGRVEMVARRAADGAEVLIGSAEVAE